MRRIRYAFILGCAAAMALAGCGKGVKDGTGQDRISHLTAEVFYRAMTVKLS